MDHSLAATPPRSIGISSWFPVRLSMIVMLSATTLGSSCDVPRSILGRRPPIGHPGAVLEARLVVVGARVVVVVVVGDGGTTETRTSADIEAVAPPGPVAVI